MSIWDDLYKDLIKVELKQDGLDSEAHDLAFKTVEAKVEELRSRVCLSTVSAMTKEAALQKHASISSSDADTQQTAIDAKAYIAGLVDLRRSSIGLRAIMDEVKNKFLGKADIIRDLEKELEEFAQKQLDKYKIELGAPIPVLHNKPEGGMAQEDNKIFENISEKLKN